MAEIKTILSSKEDEGLFLNKPVEMPLDRSMKGIALPPGWSYKEYFQKGTIIPTTNGYIHRSSCSK